MSWCPWWRRPKVEQDLYEDVIDHNIDHNSVDVNIDTDETTSINDSELEQENVVLSYDSPLKTFENDFNENLDDFVEDVTNNVGEFTENIVENIDDFKENVQVNIEEKVEDVKENVEELVYYAEEKVEDVKENVEEFMENTQEYVEEKVEDVKENVEEFMDYSQEKVEDVKENVEEFMDYSQEKIEDVKENVDEFMEDVSDVMFDRDTVINNVDDGYKADNEGGIYDVNETEMIKEVATKLVDDAVQEAIESTSGSQFEHLDTIDEEYFNENRRLSFDSAEGNRNIKPYVSHPIIDTSIEEEEEYKFPETQTRKCEVCGKLIFFNKHDKVACFRCDECLIKYMN
jgi:ElaB/YqjD/DUF883 family membrane-anchored ribosome-binding protein